MVKFERLLKVTRAECEERVKQVDDLPSMILDNFVKDLMNGKF
jgi:hypothetical protein